MSTEIKKVEKSFFDSVLDNVEGAFSTVGEYAGAGAFHVLKSLDQVHKYTTEPLIDAFNKSFNDGK